jgi:hypothetical protein
MLLASSPLCCGVLSVWKEHEDKKRTCPAVAMAVALEEEGDRGGPREAEL